MRVVAREQLSKAHRTKATERELSAERVGCVQLAGLHAPVRTRMSLCSTGVVRSSSRLVLRRQRLHLADRFASSYCSLAYSALACFRMGMSESASFQRVRKS